MAADQVLKRFSRQIRKEDACRDSREVLLAIQRSTLAENHGGTSSGDGGAIQANSSSTVTVSASTLVGNHGGGETGDGGAIQINSSGTLTVTNSTVSGNAASASRV